MKILSVCQYYWPTQMPVNDVCEQMAADGHQVTVLTGLPNYPTGVIPEKYRHGKNRVEEHNGVKIIRCFEIGRKKGAVGLSLNYLSYAMAGGLKARFLKGDFDMVFAEETSPVTMVYPGIVYARRKKIPLFLYCCDIWPECAKTMVGNEKSPAFRLITGISTWIYRRADHIAVPSKSFYGYFQDLHGIPAGRMSFLPQYSPSDYVDRDFTPEGDVTDFVFLGNVGIAQDMGGLIEAVDKIRDLPRFHVHIVGEGSFLAQAKELVREKGLEGLITFYGRRPYEEMPGFYKLADVCLATLQAGSVISLTLPAKVQGYMAAGKPIIAALSGFAREVIEESGAGLCVEPGNSGELARAMARFIRGEMDMPACGRRARAYYQQHFTKEKFMASLYALMEQTRKAWAEKGGAAP